MPDEQRDGVDQAVLLGAASGDQACWGRLVGCYSKRVYGLIWSKCRNRDIAEEVVQESFMKAVGRLGQFSDVGGFEAWLFTVARNAMLDRLRKKKRWGRLVLPAGAANEDGKGVVEDVAGDGDGPGEDIEKREVLERLRGLVGEMGEKDQEILRLRHTGGLKYEQIAEVLGEPVGTVLARGHRAVKKLRAKMIEAGLLDEALEGGGA